jgi:hypothetical protein
MWWRSPATAPAASPPRPVLDLSGPRLRQAFEALVAASEPVGGVERYVGAVALKASLFQEMLGSGRAATLGDADFRDLCTFVAPARRRIGGWLDPARFPRLRQALADLLDGAADTAGADRRLAAFLAAFPADRDHRWVRDLAAEALHFTHPELYPLMTRWVWDRKANTGVLREIWFAPDVDHITIDVADGYETFLVLREELAQFLSDNGVFRDVPYYVDLLCAQVYADYIAAQGGSYLRTDFGGADDTMQYARRMLGLDGLDSETGRTRLKLIDGRAHVVDETRLLN